MATSSDTLRQRLKQNALRIVANDPAIKGTERETAFVFDDVSMNFIQGSFAEIKKRPEWYARTQKMQEKWGFREMQSNNSSDALLMNIFCYPDFIKWQDPKKLLGISDYSCIEFGWNPNFQNEHKNAPTEIDMKIGNHIFEAKLTETDFTQKTPSVVETYVDFETVFDKNILPRTPNGEYENYQLIRNILAAYKYNYYFTLLVDETRTDLIKHLFDTVLAVKDAALRKRIAFVTWQKLTAVCGVELKNYITEKYLRQQ